MKVQSSKRFREYTKAAQQKKAALKPTDKFGRRANLRAGLDKNGKIK